MYRPNMQSVALAVPEIIVIGVFGVGLRTHNLGERGSEMLPFERAFVTSYRLSIVVRVPYS